MIGRRMQANVVIEIISETLSCGLPIFKHEIYKTCLQISCASSQYVNVHVSSCVDISRQHKEGE